MRNSLKKLWEKIKDNLLFLIFILFIASPIINVLLWLAWDGWNILDVFILGVFIVVLLPLFEK